MLKVRDTAHYNVTYSALRLWIEYYQQYGEAPAKSRRNKRRTIGGIRATGSRNFTKEHETVLRQIIDNQPQLYLDEIQEELYKETGVVWHCSTIWRKLHTIGYSLKLAVFRAKQQSQEEVDAYHIRLLDRMNHPSQLLFLDETARGANASRRRHAWSPRGVTHSHY
jgi:transposase